MRPGAGDPARPTAGQVREAAGRLAPHLAATPLRRFPALSESLDADVYLKLENRQPTGSFKIRGALNALLPEAGGPGPVVAASAGNHAFALAHAARLVGREAVLFVPSDAPAAKIAGVREAGGEVRLIDGGYDDAEDAATRWAASEPAADLIHAFDDARVVAGQGTLGLEILEQLPGVRAIVAPVGGGGLLAGLLTACDGRGVDVVGAQGDRTRAMHDALRAGDLVETPVVPTLLDGLAGRTTRRALDRLLTREARVELVPEAATAEAMRRLHALGIRAEGSGAVALAALATGAVRTADPVVVIVSGGNIDDEALAAVLAGERPPLPGTGD
ncbi:MAG: pyridoxal-phosphate dependent enzyme [Gemmatimonadota bacterium]